MTDTPKTSSIFAPRSDGQMNRIIMEQFNRSQGSYGTLAASGGVATHDRSEKLEQLTQAHAQAVAAVDVEMAEAFSYGIDEMLDAARAARGEQQPRDPATGTFASSDGGYRGHQPKPTPGGTREPTSMNGLILAAVGRA
jgi:hypothetical protein